jgi:Tol biopolymer transport system component
MKNIIYLIISSIILIGCGEEVNNPNDPAPLSDITRIGKFIAFTSDFNGNQDIFLAQVNNLGGLETINLVYPTNPFNITAVNLSNDKQSNWSPNGRVLVFSRTVGTQEDIYAFFFNSDGSLDSSVGVNPRLLVSSGGNWDNNPSFSPDGNHLIWDRREDNNGGGIDSSDSRDIFIGDLSDSGANLQVSNIRAIKDTQGEDEYNPKWSPRISVRRVAYEFQSSSTSTDHDVYIIDPFDPINNTRFYEPNNSGYPAWAPACDRIIFESDKTSGDYWKIVSLPYPVSGNPIDVVDEAGVNSRFPTWLPNGGLLAYIRFTGNNGNIYMVSVSGGTGVKLLPALYDNFNNTWPAW